MRASPTLDEFLRYTSFAFSSVSLTFSGALMPSICMLAIVSSTRDLIAASPTFSIAASTDFPSCSASQASCCMVSMSVSPCSIRVRITLPSRDVTRQIQACALARAWARLSFWLLKSETVRMSSVDASSMSFTHPLCAMTMLVHAISNMVCDTLTLSSHMRSWSCAALRRCTPSGNLDRRTLMYPLPASAMPSTMFSFDTSHKLKHLSKCSSARPISPSHSCTHASSQ
mmetsp:Transcript_40698/g.100002  ORF Transcript_40698/g.100002 Transcript_40698/m.100002 type:complete len:228 (+) Transcript_40698:668-1351(+)